MKITRYKLTFCLNALMMTLMFVGYIITSGLEIVASDAAKAAIRGLVALLAVFVVVEGRRIDFSILVAIYLAVALLAINLNEIAANLIFLLIVVASVNRLSEKDAALVFLIASLSAVLLHVALLGGGVVSAVSVQIGDRERSALGFANPNQFALVYLTLICSSFLFHQAVKTRRTFLIVCIILMLSLWVMQVSDSRTSMFSVAILLFLNFTWKILSKYYIAKKIFICGVASVPVFACGVTYYLATIKDPLLNIALSFRPSLFSAFLKGITWWDFLFGWNLAGDNVDNGYLMLLSAVGVPTFMAVVLIISKRLSEINPNFLPIAGVILVASIFESFLVRPEMPLSVIFFTMIFRNYRRISKNSLELAQP